MHYVLTSKWTLTSSYQDLASLSAHGFILKLRVTVIGRCEGCDDMGGYLHPHIELETLRVYMYVHDGQVNEEMDSHITEN